MKPLTERLVQIIALIGIAYVGYALAERSVIAVLVANQRAAVCEGKLTVMPPSAPRGPRPGG